MANILDPMDIKQIITLHLDGLSNRNIGELLGISRNTVNDYIKLLKACDYRPKELLEFDNIQLRELFPSRTTIVNPRYDDLMRFFEQMNQSKAHPGFTFLYHYTEYAENHKKPYGYTQFMEHYWRKFPKEKGSMKLEHEAGNEVFIDFAGKKLHLVDKTTGEQIGVEVFVAILPHSHYTYVEACYSQKREELLKCMGNALAFYGGVPKAIVSDNLKSAVTRASKYEPEINRSFKDFARHYNCAINPTRGYAPQDKALVENAVQLTYQRIYYPHRNTTFFSLSELNKAIHQELKKYNDMLLQRRQASRLELFQRVERQYLKPLPETAYEMKNYCRAKVQKIGYVYFSPDKTYYSVPYRLIGKNTQIHYTGTMVEVYYNYERIALHKRNPTKGIYITNKEHLSSTHKAYSQWSPAYFKSLAAKHGVNVQAFIEALLAQSDYPETSYKRALGVIHLHKQYGDERLDNACQYALCCGIYSYNRIKNILKNNMDKMPEQPIKAVINTHIPQHANIRGAAAYN